jgi:hypothetical protein
MWSAESIVVLVYAPKITEIDYKEREVDYDVTRYLVEKRHFELI